MDNRHGKQLQEVAVWGKLKKPPSSRPILIYFEFRSKPSLITVIWMDPHSPKKFIATKYCFLILGDDTSFFFLIISVFLRLFVILCYFAIINFYKIILLLLFYLIKFFSWKLFLFLHVPGCSGMFRHVLCSGFYRHSVTTDCKLCMTYYLQKELLLRDSWGGLIRQYFPPPFLHSQLVVWHNYPAFWQWSCGICCQWRLLPWAEEFLSFLPFEKCSELLRPATVKIKQNNMQRCIALE